MKELRGLMGGGRQRPPRVCEWPDAWPPLSDQYLCQLTHPPPSYDSPLSRSYNTLSAGKWQDILLEYWDAAFAENVRNTTELKDRVSRHGKPETIDILNYSCA